jgi:hypothetical protein
MDERANRLIHGGQAAMRVLQNVARLRREKSSGLHQTHPGEGVEQSAAVPAGEEVAGSEKVSR